MVVLSFQQNRWWGTADAVWIAILAAALFVALSVASVHRGGARRLVIAATVLTLLPTPIITVREWVALRFRLELDFEDVTQLIVRDVAQNMRRRLGREQGVVLSDPTSTTLFIYFGGLRGLGSLYWENVDGLKQAAAIYGAPSSDSAYALIRAHGVTHIATFSWNFFTPQYALLSQGLPKGATASDSGFVWRMFTRADIPPWLAEHRLSLPEADELRNEWGVVFDVQPSSPDGLPRAGIPGPSGR
jgi:hypothetical protein